MGSLAAFIAEIAPYVPQLVADAPAIITAVKTLIANHEAATAEQKQDALNALEVLLEADAAEAAQAANELLPESK